MGFGAITSSATGGFKLFIKYVKISSFFLLFFIVFFNAVIQSIESRSPMPFIEDVGNKLILSSRNLAIQSEEVISNSYSFDSWKNGYNSIILLSNFLLAVWIILAWIRVFSYILAKTPLSFEDYSFAKYLFGFIAFYIVQVISLLSYAGLTSQLKTREDVVYFVLLPLTSVYLFFKACLKLLNPLSKTLDVKLLSSDVNLSIR
jgi:hypothetical protein